QRLAAVLHRLLGAAVILRDAAAPARFVLVRGRLVLELLLLFLVLRELGGLIVELVLRALDRVVGLLRPRLRVGYLLVPLGRVVLVLMTGRLRLRVVRHALATLDVGRALLHIVRDRARVAAGLALREVGELLLGLL